MGYHSILGFSLESENLNNLIYKVSVCWWTVLTVTQEMPQLYVKVKWHQFYGSQCIYNSLLAQKNVQNTTFNSPTVYTLFSF